MTSARTDYKERKSSLARHQTIPSGDQCYELVQTSIDPQPETGYCSSIGRYVTLVRFAMMDLCEVEVFGTEVASISSTRANSGGCR